MDKQRSKGMIFGKKGMGGRIKNLPQFKKPKDFEYNAFSFLVLGLFLAAGIVLQFTLGVSAIPVDIISVAAGFITIGVIILILPLWSMVIAGIILSGLGVIAKFGIDLMYIYTLGALGLVFSSSFQLVYQWDKIVILRLGRFRNVKGPGITFLLPFLDRIAAFVDTRIRVTDFSAERTLTNDSVPVHVDALTFWMIWDPQKAVLEVENYLEAVILSAQTALRDSIGKHNLLELLSEREELGKEIQKILDRKTNPWGITILSIEMTEILIPKELEDAMSKQAQAERERQSRIILGTAEVEIAKKFEEAAQHYKDNSTAMNLRAMNMVYEGLRHNKGSMMVIPSSALDSMNLGTVLGTAAMQKINENPNNEKEPQITEKPDNQEEERI